MIPLTHKDPNSHWRPKKSTDLKLTFLIMIYPLNLHIVQPGQNDPFCFDCSLLPPFFLSSLFPAFNPPSFLLPLLLSLLPLLPFFLPLSFPPFLLPSSLPPPPPPPPPLPLRLPRP